MSPQLCEPSSGKCPDRLRSSVIQIAWLQSRKAQKSLEIQREANTLHPLCCCSLNGAWAQHRQQVQQLKPSLYKRNSWLAPCKQIPMPLQFFTLYKTIYRNFFNLKTAWDMHMENSIHAWIGGKINNKKNINPHRLVGTGSWFAYLLFTAILSTHRHEDKWLHVIFYYMKCCTSHAFFWKTNKQKHFLHWSAHFLWTSWAQFSLVQLQCRWICPTRCRCEKEGLPALSHHS